MKIRALCIDDENKPKEIPQTKWIKKGDKYHIKHIYLMVNQDKISGCDIWERDLSLYKPYNCFRLSRFAIHEDDVQKLKELIKACDELNQLSDDDIQRLIEQTELMEVEN